MGIIRNDPVMNMDTNEPLRFIPPDKRFTRAQAHRLLKANDVPHNVSAPLEELLYLIEIKQIHPQLVPPGKMESEIVEYPNNVPKLRALCKAQGIKFKNTDKMEDLKKRLREGV
jgi:hypothetical protein